MNEFELKFLVERAAIDALAQAPAMPELAAGTPETVRLRTIYHDTASGSLGAAGIALRLRHDGGGWVQTVKSGRVMRGGLSEAREIDVALGAAALDLDAIPDADMRAAIAELLGDAELAPVFETEITRTRRRLVLPYLGEVELALDVGQLRAGERAAALCEAEFELLSGSPHAVFEAARRLLPPRGVQLSTLSKAQRGALLARKGTILAEPEARAARPVSIDAGQTAEQAAHAILSECLDQIVANLDAVARSDAPEGPHQLRVGLRRLRSALQFFEGVVAGPVGERIEAEARWLGHRVGALRDLDVAIDDVVRPLISPDAAEGRDPTATAASAAEQPGFASLLAALEDSAARTRTALRAELAGPRVLAFAIDLTEFVAVRGWLDPSDWDQTRRLACPLPETAAGALDQRLHKAARRAGHIERLDIDQRHDLRKELKKLRYGVEFLSTLYPDKKVRPFLKRLKALQQIFGELNDAAMVARLFRDPDGPASRDTAAARAAGYLIGVRDERARASWDHARALWKALRETAPFWR